MAKKRRPEATEGRQGAPTAEQLFLDIEAKLNARAVDRDAWDATRVNETIQLRYGANGANLEVLPIEYFVDIISYVNITRLKSLNVVARDSISGWLAELQREENEKERNERTRNWFKYHSLVEDKKLAERLWRGKCFYSPRPASKLIWFPRVF